MTKPAHDNARTRGKWTVLSLFTGAGGLDLGLEAAGLEPIGCIEVDEDCARTLETNRPSWKLLDSPDVVMAAGSLRPRDLGLRRRELDLLAGGPPCQPFSTAGQWARTGRLGMRDGRASTVEAMLDLLERFLPRILLIENVAGFLRGNVSALPYINARLEEINKASGTRYELHAAVVDAAQYGVPQHRKRVIAVACRDGTPFQLPEPTHANEPMRAWDAIGDLNDSDTLPAVGIWADLLPSIPEGSNYQYLTTRGMGEELFGYRTRYWSFLLKLAKDRPAWTLPANPGPSTGPFHWDNRPLTIRERLRLQSFPDEWELAGTRSSQIRQAGNATPPLLAEVIGRAIVRQVLDPHHESNSGFRLLRPRGGQPPEPRPPTPIPQRYRNDIGPQTPHPGPGKGPAPRQALADDASGS